MGQNFKRIMVGLDLSDMDEYLVKYTNRIVKTGNIEKIVFVHAHKVLDLPDEIKTEIYGNNNDSVNEYVLDMMKDAVKNHGDDLESLAPIEYVVLEGSPLPQLINASNQHDIDLLMVGRKKEKHGSGNVLARLTRRSKASVFIVPEETIEPAFDNILLCTDYSKSSKSALERSISIAELGGNNSTIYCQHIFKVPMGYHKSGKSLEDVAHIMKKHAKLKYQDFIKEVKLRDADVHPIFSLHTGDSAGITNETATSVQAGIIVVGSKGRTYAASIFLGSFAEKMIHQNLSVPLLIVKRKGEVIDILDAIKRL